MREVNIVQPVLVGRHQEKRLFQTPGVFENVVLKLVLRWILRKLEGVVGTGWSWLRIGTGGGHLWVR
jgi:hypothetical protein